MGGRASQGLRIDASAGAGYDGGGHGRGQTSYGGAAAPFPRRATSDSTLGAYGEGGAGGGAGGEMGRGLARGPTACSSGAIDSRQDRQDQSARGVQWSIKPVCADKMKRTAPMRKSWHALVGPSDDAPSSSPPSTAEGRSPPAKQPQPRGQQPRPAGGGLGSRHTGSCSQLSGVGGYGGGSGGGGGGSEARPPSTPPNSSLWAKRRGAADASPGSVQENLKLMSVRDQQWEELQSPLDAFANKHCPRKGADGGSHPSIVHEAEGEDSPSWHRPANSSPLAALLRREFPGPAFGGRPGGGAGGAGGGYGGETYPERRLFDDL